MPARSAIFNAVVLPAVLALATAAAFSQVLGGEFVDFDDDFYVYANPNVRQGLSAESVRWAFTTFNSGTWCPIDWLSLELDARLFGLQPWGYHLTSLVLHVVNAVLLYAFLLWLTGHAWPSFFASALFALHPLHVESVAWAASRQDVLGTFFLLLSLLCYAAYARRGGVLYYAASLMAFALGLMTTPILAVWPAIYLLLDFWPLGRFVRTEAPAGSPAQKSPVSGSRLVWEKLPFFLLAALAGAITWHALRRGTLVAPVAISLAQRLLNALASYGDYAYQTVFPVDLAAFYPHPATALGGGIPLWKPPLALFGLLGMTAWVARSARRRPYLLVGWLWFIVTLLPVIGLIQVGGQARADRYTYLPLVGLFVMWAWSLRKWAQRGGWRRVVAGGLAGFALAACGVLSWRQVGFWHDSHSLWRRAAAVTDANFVAHGHLTNLAISEGNMTEALAHAEMEVRFAPWEINAQKFVAEQYCRRGDDEDALPHYEAILKFGPPDPAVHLALARALLRVERFDDAKTECENALRHNPSSADAASLLGRIHAAQHELTDAMESYQAALRLDPSHAETRERLRELLEQADADGAVELSARIRKTLARYSN